MASREQQVIRVGILNVVTNLVLAAVKIVMGRITQSIAITLDGVNSLTDGFSSALTIVGTKLAQMPADEEHPFGHGRYEYLTSFVVAALIIAAGSSSLSSSVQAITEGGTSTYTAASLVIIGIACTAKASLGLFTRKTGRRLNSSPLVANGTDSLMDSLVSAATLVAAVLNIMFQIGIESYLAAGISVLIVKSGIDILIDTISKLLGERQDPKLASKVEKVARSVEGVRLTSGVVLMDFGPNTHGGSLHVTVNGNMTVSEFDMIAREVYHRVLDECGVRLVSVGVYPTVEVDEKAREARATISRVLWGYEHIIEVCGLFMDMERKTCRFDAIVDFTVRDISAFENEVRGACEAALPEFSCTGRVRPYVGD